MRYYFDISGAAGGLPSSRARDARRHIFHTGTIKYYMSFIAAIIRGRSHESYWADSHAYEYAPAASATATFLFLFLFDMMPFDCFAYMQHTSTPIRDSTPSA